MFDQRPWNLLRAFLGLTASENSLIFFRQFEEASLNVQKHPTIIDYACSQGLHFIEKFILNIPKDFPQRGKSNEELEINIILTHGVLPSWIAN